MLDSALKDQLRPVLARLEHPVELAVDRSVHPKQAELSALLEELAALGPMIRVVDSGADSSVPRLEVRAAGKPAAVAFSGVPGGHEFSSLVLAILNADGKGKWPDEALVRRIRALAGPVRLKTYVSLSCENCPEVVQALNLMALCHADFRHEMVDGELAQDDVRRLNLQGVPAVVSGDRLVSSGKTALIDLLAKLEAHFGVGAQALNAGPADLGVFDVVVIGGGPAGASAAIYTARKGLKTVVITDRMGGQLRDTKGIENFISVRYTEGAELSQKLSEHLAHYGVQVLEHRRVEKIEDGQPRRVHLSGRESLGARAIIVTTGAKWRELGVPGEKEYIGRGVAFCPHCDGPFYKGKDVAVIGGGNSGVEAAIDLAGIVRSVTLLEFLPQLKADRVLVDKLTALPNVTVIKNARTAQVLADGQKVTGLEYEDRASSALQRLTLDGVFVQIGLAPNSAVVKDLVETNKFGEIVVDAKGRTSAKGIYAAGDVTTVPYKQIVIAQGEGAKAALAAFEDLVLAR